ncbi:MAG: hypothetical protein R3F59_38575, partial [Myxococcota bacterium]
RTALVQLGTSAAVRALAERLSEEGAEGDRYPTINALSRFRGEARVPAVRALIELLASEDTTVRRTAFDAALQALGTREDAEKLRRPGPPLAHPPEVRPAELTLELLSAAARSRYPELRVLAANQLDVLAHPEADELLRGLFNDRERDVRIAAVAAYARRVIDGASDAAPLRDVLRGGARETLLSAARGLAAAGDRDAFRPLLLFVRAGADGEREQALLSLGVLGDLRALEELEEIAAGGTEEAPVEPPMQAAAVEALGRMYRHVEDGDVRERIRDRVDASLANRMLSASAVQALAQMGGERSRSRLEGIVATPSSNDRVAAAIALREFADPASEKPLAGVLGDWYSELRWAAYEALRAIFPADRTRVELHAVQSYQDDLAEPAATYLAAEGAPAALLTILGTLTDDDLRERLRIGLARREHVPAGDVAALLRSDNPVARADAAWVCGIRAERLDPAEREQLGSALVDAASGASGAGSRPGSPATPSAPTARSPPG